MEEKLCDQRTAGYSSSLSFEAMQSDHNWEERMDRDASRTRRADIVPQIVALIGVGYSIDDALIAGAKLAAFVEG